MKATAARSTSEGKTLPPPKKQRSRVSNGRSLFITGPETSAAARRFRDILAEIVSDLGGHDGLSERSANLPVVALAEFRLREIGSHHLWRHVVCGGSRVHGGQRRTIALRDPRRGRTHPARHCAP